MKRVTRVNRVGVLLAASAVVAVVACVEEGPTLRRCLGCSVDLYGRTAGMAGMAGAAGNGQGGSAGTGRWQRGVPVRVAARAPARPVQAPFRMPAQTPTRAEPVEQIFLVAERG
jgi:hypothetical protein